MLVDGFVIPGFFLVVGAALLSVNAEDEGDQGLAVARKDEFFDESAAAAFAAAIFPARFGSYKRSKMF